MGFRREKKNIENMIDTAREQAVVWKTYPDYPFIKANQLGEVKTVDRTVVGKDVIEHN